ncbi:alpha/beta hydrolase [Sulfuritalea sp.]|uniref:alpha/beta fold hydrolase n=1 Tax=Sulfuritalea sp. TaxID=2480090 RepID=UPI0025F78D9E|nr:alpha/beta hydrolase [Sulfuritalea sp.]
MAYVEWGDATNPRVLVCVHGLSRCSRDFDFLAQAMAADYRVVCPDVVGRGRSDWLRNKSLYALPQYCADMTTLLAKLGAETVDWVGTSMGGLIGMVLASQPETPIRRLVLNDVGPVITAASLERIGTYLGAAPRFDGIEQAEAFVRFVSASFGNFDDAQWRHLTVHVTRVAADGKVEFAYDPGIAQAFREVQAASGGKDIELWPAYDGIACPTLLLRGATSDLLTHEAALEMGLRGPRARLVEVPGVGHAPMLMDSGQVAPVREFLLA